MPNQASFYSNNALDKKTIGPGDYATVKSPTVITTLLGSCVSVCLFDPDNKIAGMNHFLLASPGRQTSTDIEDKEAGRYGTYAMELLIQSMLNRGAERKNLQAKAFGGGDVLPKERKSKFNYYCIGENNREFVCDYLTRNAIPLVSSDLGGDHGRSIFFQSSDFSVYVRKINKQSIELMAAMENLKWIKNVKGRFT